MRNKDYTQLIHAYYEGTLVGADKSLFKQLLKEEADFKAEVKAYKKIFKGLGGLHLDHLKQEMNKWEKAQKEVKTPVVSISSFRIYLAIAAAIAMLLSMPLIYQSLVPNDPFEQHFHASSSFAIHAAAVRDSKNLATYESIKGTAFMAYQKKDYKTTIKQLKDYIYNFEKEAKGDSQSFLILAIAQIAEEHYQNAIPNLE